LLDGGAVFSYRNGEEGQVSGLELDFRKEFPVNNLNFFVAGNYSIIDSEVSIVGEERQMQGQPDQLVNLQLGLDDLERGLDYTLIFNHKGESLYSAALPGSGSPEILEDERSELDFNVNYDLGSDVVVRARLKNILDEEVSLSQGGNNYRSYKKGRE